MWVTAEQCWWDQALWSDSSGLVWHTPSGQPEGNSETVCSWETIQASEVLLWSPVWSETLQKCRLVCVSCLIHTWSHHLFWGWQLRRITKWLLVFCFLPPSGLWSTMSIWREREHGQKVLRWQSINLLLYERWVVLVSPQKLSRRSIHITVSDICHSCEVICSWLPTSHSAGRGKMSSKIATS